MTFKSGVLRPSMIKKIDGTRSSPAFGTFSAADSLPDSPLNVFGQIRRIADHLPLVRSIAVRVHANMPRHIELSDLIQAGIMGLSDAASRFDPAKEVAFPSYAKHRIQGSILDELRRANEYPAPLAPFPSPVATAVHKIPTSSEFVAEL